MLMIASATSWGTLFVVMIQPNGPEQPMSSMIMAELSAAL